MKSFQRFLTRGVFAIAASAGIAAADVASTQPTELRPPFNWVTTAPLVTIRPDAQRPAVSIKDPSIVRFNDRWHLFATYATTAGSWGMVYSSFADWKDAATAPQHFLDDNVNLRGYHCAPQVFYFAPQKQWYLIYQSGQPQFSTNADVAKPQDWTRPQDFFAGTPKSVVDGWLDFWIICDDAHAYLFFADDHGRFYRSHTTLAAFPKGFEDPVVVLQDAVARELFEGDCVYHVKGTSQYVALVEAGNEQWTRYYKAFTTDRLDGTWRPLAATWGNSFADGTRVRTADGSPLWADGISHGEMLRDGYDQTMTIDPANLTLLYQGLPTDRPAKLDYSQLPYRLGLLHATPAKVK